MRRRRSQVPDFDEWPLHLRMLIHAAERECPSGHANALKELMSLAITKVPARGIFDPTAGGEPVLFAAFETIANRHLGMADARASWRKALRSADIDLEVRDGIEHAALRVQGASDTVYYYAGLAFGLACASIYRANS